MPATIVDQVDESDPSSPNLDFPQSEEEIHLRCRMPSQRVAIETDDKKQS